MSWQLASYLILALVLLGGFAWYERSRPTSQVVALVAALAALAVAGRLAFAALPNVVATTDIVIFAGYALGAAPGFAVGALAGLVSNFWLGQGPWTPWQMAGWGLCGVLAAALALGGRNAGRLTLASVCGFAGIAYGALLNFSLMATYGGDLSMHRFLALESRAVPFDAAHAIGNVTLALIAGPAMVRMLIRFRERFDWRLARAASAVILALALASALPAEARASDIGSAVGWLVSARNSDGGWGATPASSSSTAMTAWAMLGLEAAGRNPLDISLAERTPVDFLREHVDELSSSGDFSRTILALEGAGVDPRSFGGRDLVAALAKRRRADGSFEGWPGTTAFAVMALREAGATGGLNRSMSWLAQVQNPDGGWGDVPGSPSSPDVTGAVMQAMPNSDAARHGLAYLRRTQRPSGGFSFGGSGPVNSQSTAWAVQGTIAVGADPASISTGGRTPLDYLSARQAPDGHFAYSADSDQTPVWVTGQALAAAAGKSFPLPPAPRSTRKSVPTFSGGHAPSPSGSPKASPSRPSGGALPPAPGANGKSAQSSPKGLLKSLREGGAKAPPGGPPPAVQPPAQSGVPPLPLGSGALGPGGAEPVPAPAGSPVVAIEPFTASAKRGPEPWTPLGIGLGTGGLALGGVILLGRRFGW